MPNIKQTTRFLKFSKSQSLLLDFTTSGLYLDENENSQACNLMFVAKQQPKDTVIGVVNNRNDQTVTCVLNR